MSKVQIQVEVSENTHAVVSALVDLALKVKHQLDDGLQLIDDISTLMPEVIGLADEVMRLSQVDDELKEDPGAWAMALTAAAKPLADAFRKPSDGSAA